MRKPTEQESREMVHQAYRLVLDIKTLRSECGDYGKALAEYKKSLDALGLFHSKLVDEDEQDGQLSGVDIATVNLHGVTHLMLSIHDDAPKELRIDKPRVATPDNPTPSYTLTTEGISIRKYGPLMLAVSEPTQVYSTLYVTLEDQLRADPNTPVALTYVGLHLEGTPRLMYSCRREETAREFAKRDGVLYGHSPFPHHNDPELHWFTGTREELTHVGVTDPLDPNAPTMSAACRV